MHTKSILLASVALVAASLGFAHEGHDHAAMATKTTSASGQYPLTTCVVSGDNLDDPVHYVYKQPGQPDRVVEFCCKDCIADFQKDPAKYLAKLDAAYAAQKAGGTTAMTAGAGAAKAGMAGMKDCAAGMQCAMGDTCTDPSQCRALAKTYVPVAEALAADDLSQAKTAAATLAKQADTAGMKALAGHATTIANAATLDDARTGLKALSRDLEPAVQGSKDFVVMYCPMADADWIQADAHVRNPYFGKKMPGCGEPKVSQN